MEREMIRHSHDLEHDDNEDDNEAVYNISKSNEKNKPKKCFNCGKVGHIA